MRCVSQLLVGFGIGRGEREKMGFAIGRICFCIVLLVTIHLHLQVIAGKPTLPLELNTKILQESVVKSINDNVQAGWKASMNPRFANYTVGQFMHLLGVKSMPKGDLKDISVVTHKSGLNLPKTFDARTAWPQCSTIGKILDQVTCFSFLSFLTRFPYLLPNDICRFLTACCGFMCGDGCDGGYPISAWRYFVHTGVVTEECDPYFDNTGCSHPGCEPAYPTPKCEKKCKRENLPWEESKRFGVSAYRISSDPYSIMAEILKNGPVEVSFTVYEDFAYYKSGVYKHMTGDEMGGHAVKLIGWGTTDNGEDYWLLANQWNRSWGDDGYFMIRRGTNECGIEEDVVAGLPSPRNLITAYGRVDTLLDASI
ncbi:hypothetical protein BUALT_Bualt15G0131000 [Buddleja alternifolia]|uniref:Peptidase C1A papain C-terminal domain-containing protein n=1 Tax=Buddleja alternifolia TaxID=168488 RepID=A0AAV6WQI9_9LAMI|nr:hypothetical protein BUALT_Bualt15G0131000 [Buddleja alternifolia]